MKASLILPATICGALLCSADEAAQATHYSLAQEVINLLSETELTLGSCTDAAGVEAALPRLEELAEQAHRLRKSQLSLPDSTVQEDIAIARMVQDFQTIWEAIRAHIERLESSGLMSDKLRQVLRIAPTTN